MPRFSEPFADSLDDLDRWEDAPPDLNPHPDPAAALEALATTLTKAQAEAAAQAGPILVLAGAGTGKTSTLTAAVGLAQDWGCVANRVNFGSIS